MQSRIKRYRCNSGGDVGRHLKQQRQVSLLYTTISSTHIAVDQVAAALLLFRIIQAFP
jgi:hypothetical protein